MKENDNFQAFYFKFQFLILNVTIAYKIFFSFKASQSYQITFCLLNYLCTILTEQKKSLYKFSILKIGIRNISISKNKNKLNSKILR